MKGYVNLTHTNNGKIEKTRQEIIEYVDENGGKIDSISVNGVPQTIDENKNVDLTIPESSGGIEGVDVVGNGNAVTTGSYDSTTQRVTLTKGIQFQTETDNSLETQSKVVSSAINEVNSIAKGATSGKGFTSYSALITDLNSASADKYKTGQSFYIQTLNVPDLWVISVEETSVPYTYTTDSAFISATGAVGGQQVGYYKLAQLETQKVDLTNYVQKTTTIAGVDLQDNITKSELLSALNVEDGAEVNDIASISAGGTALTPDANKNVNIPVATTSNLGVVKGNKQYGTSINNDGSIVLEIANNIEIADRTAFKVICGSNLNNSVKAALTDANHLTMNSTEQETAQTVLGVNTLTGSGAPTTSTVGNVGQFYIDTTNNKTYQCIAITEDTSTTPSTFTYTWVQLIRVTDKATTSVYGIVKIAQGRGLDFLGDGGLYVDVAGDAQITNRTIGRPIAASSLNFAVKSALTDANHLTMTSAEQATAKSVLGIPDIEIGLARLDG